MKQPCLKAVPDFLDWSKALQWVQEGQKLLKEPLHIHENDICSLEWSDIVLPSTPVFGLYPLENWRKFVLATYFADLVSYPNPIDQVNFERLVFVMHAFPQGFRTWWIPISNHWWPVGYSAWYPMLETAFEVFEKHPERLKDRMVVPNPSSLQQHPFLYLFNFSATPQLKGSILTKQLMKSFVKEIENTRYAGLACIAVSSEGVRIAQRLGMNHTGNIPGSSEGVYVKRLYKR